MEQARLAAGWLKQKYKLLTLLAVALFGGFSMLFAPLASAAETATWKDNKTISYQGVDYKDKGTLALAYNASPGKTYHVFASDIQSNGCLSEIYFDTSTDVGTATAANFMAGQIGQGPSGSTGQCIGATGGKVSFKEPLTGTSGGTTGTTSTDAVDPCDAQADSPLSWFICPVIGLINAAVTWMQKIIDSLLAFDIKPVFDKSTDTGQAYFSAWNSFRLFAIAFIVITGLVMVIAQALGFDIFDAYTVKKVLPRLIVAAIGISLSWYLLEFLAELTNDLGIGIRSIIYYPFRNLGDSVISTAGGDFLTILLGTLVSLSLGIGGVLTLFATAGLAVLIAFLVLILRQMVLIFLILLSPIAIACYVLPNTKKYYDLWWDSIMKGFMMFPIITGFIAVGRVFAVVSSSTTGGAGQSVNQVIGLIAFFLPYFALPFTFRLAGGALATIGGLTNDRSRGLFDGLRNRRKAIMSDRFKRAQSQSLWDNNSRIGRGMNKAASWATDPVSNALYATKDVRGLRAITGKRGYGVASAIEHQQVEQTGKLFEEINKMGFNDKAYRALSGTYEPDDPMRQKLAAAGIKGPPQSLGDLQRVADVLATGSTTDQIAANAIHANMGRLANLYRDPEMTKANLQGAGIMGLAAHGFATTRDLAAAANGMQDSVGTGAASAIIGQAQLMGARSHPETKNGYGVLYDQKKGEFVDGMKGNENLDARDEAMLTTLNSHDLAGAKGGAFDEIKPIITKALAPPRADASEKERIAAEAKARAVQEQMFSWAGPYSQASVDIKAKTLAYMQENSERATRTRTVRGADGKTRTENYEGWAEGSLMDRFERYARTETDPSVRGEGGQEPPDQGGPGGPGGPPGGGR